MPKEKTPAMHWLLRVLSVFIGIIFALFGALFVVACIAMLSQGANAPAAAKVGTTFQIVMTVFFALIALFGVFLIWLGVRRGNVASACPAEPERLSVAARESGMALATGASFGCLPAQPAASATPLTTRVPALESQATTRVPPVPPTSCDKSPILATQSSREVLAELHSTDWPAPVPHADQPNIDDSLPSDAELGQFIARCGPEKSGELYNYISAGVYLAIGLFCVLAPGRFIEINIDPGLAAKLALLPAGLGIAFAIFHVWTPLFGAPQTIELYERGIVERVGKQVRRIELATIEHLRLQEWYEHRFADRTFNVKARISGQRQLAFNTALRGEATQIIQYLASQISNTEIVEFNASL